MPEIPVPQDREAVIELLKAVAAALEASPDPLTAKYAWSIACATIGAALTFDERRLALHVQEFSREQLRRAAARN